MVCCIFLQSYLFKFMGHVTKKHFLFTKLGVISDNYSHNSWVSNGWNWEGKSNKAEGAVRCMETPGGEWGLNSRPELDWAWLTFVMPTYYNSRIKQPLSTEVQKKRHRTEPGEWSEVRRRDAEVRSVARIFQARVEPELAFPGRFRRHGHHHHRVFS